VHAAGILHRDLKPSNVLLTNAGELKVSDFSLAKIRSDDPSLTVADDVLGTPSYMAPEQARGEAHRVGPEADIYSLGAILYELLTGRPPFLGATVLDTLALIRTQDPVPPRQLQPKTPRDLQTICLQCLNKSPDARYRSAADLCDDLLRYLNGQPILARRPGPIDQLRRFIRRHPALAILAGAAFIVATALVAAKAYSDANERRSSAAALVDAISTADVNALPQLLRGVSERNELTLPLLRKKKQAAAAREPSWVNLSIAELTADPKAPAEPLLEYLPSAQPAEVAPIISALKQHADAIHDPLWQMLLDDSASDAARLRLACLAARTAPAVDSWPTVAPAVCNALVRQHPLDIATFTVLLRPARSQLVPALVEMLESSDLSAVDRRSAISIAARFITHEVDLLVTLAVDSQPDEFALLYPTLEAQRDAVLPQLKSAAAAVRIESLAEANPSESPRDIERAFDRSIRRSATAAIASWRLDNRESVRNALHGNDASLRAWIIELLVPLGVMPSDVSQELATATDARYRQALILALGQARRDASTNDAAALRNTISEIFRTDPDAGVHSACRWLLVRLGASDVVTQFESEFPLGPSPDRRWFHAANKHLFNTVLIPPDFRAGSPVTEFWRETDEVPDKYGPPPAYTIAVSAHETTVEQFHKFKPGAGNLLYSATPDSPINNVTWFDAARYCRWLSEQDGVAEDQMVFPPAGAIGPDMKLPKNWLARTGYRLPLHREFEFACRAGTTTSRYSGAGRELLPNYAWHLNCSDDHAWPVGLLKPNGFGLFDMLGNVAERCHHLNSAPPIVQIDHPDVGQTGDAEFVPIGSQGLAIGGDFGDLSQNTRAARRAGVPANQQWATIGFRVVRTMAPSH
jgi:formylglycine-generating enzyme required for sulfatase activity